MSALHQINAHILVVEDSRTQAAQIRTHLRKHNFLVDLAHNGEDALAWLQSQTPDLILSDIVMPGMSGYDLCRTIKGDPQLEATPFVLMTALSSLRDVVEGIKCGANGFLEKPCTETQLVERIEEVLYNQRLARTDTSVEIYFDGEHHKLPTGNNNMFDLVLSTFSSAVKKNKALEEKNRELATTHQRLARAHEELQDVENRVRHLTSFYEQILNSIPAEVAVYNPKFRYDFLNPTAINDEKIRAWSIGKDDFSLSARLGTNPQVARTRQHWLRRVFEEKRTVSYEEVANDANGEARHFVRFYSPIFSNDGAVQQATSFSLDITDRVQAEAMHQASEERFARIATASPNLLYVYDQQEETNVYINASFSTTLGYTPEELEAMEGGMNALVHPEDQPSLAFTRAQLGSAPEGYAMDSEFRLRHADGTWRWFAGRDTVLTRDESGTVLQIVGAAQDISDRKQQERDLYNAWEAAQEATRTKSAFLANMSHEIRTPMNGVLGMAEQLLHTTQTEEQRDFTEAIIQSGEMLLTVINDILDFSKIEAGKLALEQTSFDLNRMMAQAIELFAVKAEQQGVTLAWELTPDVPSHIVGDPHRLRQILSNLIGNALKFTKEGYVVVRVANETPDYEEPTLSFSITDTGIGISEEKQALLFQAFSQVDASTTRKFGGTGLGLAISRQLVEMMHGTIGVKSTEGVGSTFSFTIQTRVAAAAQETAASIALPANIKAPLVLIQHSNNTVRELLVNQLLPRGFEVADIAEFDAAWNELKLAQEDGEPYRFFLTETQALEHHTEVLSELKDLLHKTNAHLLGLTSFSHRSISRKVESIGLASCHHEPIDSFALLRVLAPLASGKKLTKTSNSGAKTSLSLPQNAKILLVEDNRVNRKVALAHLKRLGLQHIDTAENGLEAVEAIQRTTYALVLMDVQMPVMDGYEATAHIRSYEHQHNRHTPIIALTADAMEGARDRCIANGMDDFLTKPFKVAQLHATLEHWLTAEEVIEEFEEPQGIPSLISDLDIARAVHAGLTELYHDLDDVIMDDLLSMFVEGMDERIHVLRESIFTEDHKAVEQSAHALKGSCYTMGLAFIAGRFEVLERFGNSNELQQASMLLEEIDQLYQKAHPHLLAFKASLSKRSAA